MFKNRKNTLLVIANIIITLLLFIYLTQIADFDNVVMVTAVWIVNTAILWVIVAYDAGSDDDEEESR
ncbi:MAG: DUF6534 domain-containing protein [Chloroflexota bacterium]